MAGWAQGKSWITPALFLARGNVARDFLYPDIVTFKDWNFLTDDGDGRIGVLLRQGYDIAAEIGRAHV